MLVAEKIASIKTKLAQLATRDPDTTTVTSANCLGECLDEGQISHVEHQIGCRLPEDYRRFLAEVGNGGLGPGIGLTPLGADSLIDPRIPVDGQFKLNPSASFPYAGDWNFLPLKQALEEQSPQLDELLVYYFDAARIDGTIHIADLGCGAIALLVLNGPQRGRVWLDFRGTYGGIAPATLRHDDTDALDFLTWYDVWLGESLTQSGPVAP